MNGKKKTEYSATLKTRKFFIINKTKKLSKWPLINEWIQKLWYTETMEYYSALKRSAFESHEMRWMDTDPVIRSEVSQRDKTNIII